MKIRLLTLGYVFVATILLFTAAFWESIAFELGDIYYQLTTRTYGEQFVPDSTALELFNEASPSGMMEFWNGTCIITFSYASLYGQKTKAYLYRFSFKKFLKYPTGAEKPCDEIIVRSEAFRLFFGSSLITLRVGSPLYIKVPNLDPAVYRYKAFLVGFNRFPFLTKSRTSMTLIVPAN